MFKHDFLEPGPIMEQITTPTGRVYRFDGKEYQSVTTFLGKLLETEKSINKWKERVGTKEANRVSTQAARRGTAVHNICEKYLLNQKDFLADEMPINISAFSQLKKVIDKNIGTVYGVEQMLHSDKYKLAGTADVICEWKGMPAIVDFKTSRKPKKLEWITGYLYQSALYGHMVESLYGIDIRAIAIIICVDHEDVQVFEHSRKAIMARFDKAWTEYSENNA